IIPMAVEEPSIIASASYIAKIVRESGGFTTEATDRLMIGQIQVVGCPDFGAAKSSLLREKEQLVAEANAAFPSMVARVGGAEDVDGRVLNEDADSNDGKVVGGRLDVDTCDAMGANMNHTLVDALPRTIERLTEGGVY